MYVWYHSICYILFLPINIEPCDLAWIQLQCHPISSRLLILKCHLNRYGDKNGIYHDNTCTLSQKMLRPLLPRIFAITIMEPIFSTKGPVGRGNAHLSERKKQCLLTKLLWVDPISSQMHSKLAIGHRLSLRLYRWGVKLLQRLSLSCCYLVCECKYLAGLAYFR